ncbi:hypothetical protein IC614_07640 [Allosphingosinicella flava]|uniref:Uncharacterized protein n=1 Tax=Allosphingosinicella flava TaxID=2771430 RepID=A0A7T2LL85_9SPHN|nr:hypothetical protein [Sphingosinicella flava]QPQ54236.1 hypothetical protein IC614_07640 [Sphingosinicella flava]
MKIAGAVVAGVIIAFLCIFGLEAVSHSLFPLPAGIDVSDPAQLAGMMDKIPTGAKVAVVAGWFVGALAGAWVACRIAGRALAGWIVAILVAVSGVATMLMIPHPAWMWAAGILLPPLAAYIAQRLARVAV